MNEASLSPTLFNFCTGQEGKCTTFQNRMAEVQAYLAKEGSNLIRTPGPLIKTIEGSHSALNKKGKC